MTTALALASDAVPLRSRLGKGARFDAAAAPVDALRLARHGMAFFARQLNALSDDQLARTSAVPGWSRAHVVAHVSLAARIQAPALTDLRGQQLEDDFNWDSDLDLTAAFPPRALRHLYDHAHVHMNVEWRDLTDHHWSMTATLPGDDRVPVVDLPKRQAALLWWGAIALNASASRDEIPAATAVPSGRLPLLPVPIQDCPTL